MYLTKLINLGLSLNKKILFDEFLWRVYSFKQMFWNAVKYKI